MISQFMPTRAQRGEASPVAQRLHAVMEVAEPPEIPRSARDKLKVAGVGMIRKLKSGEFRLYSRKKDPKSGKRRNLGTFKSRAAAEKHERAVQFFKRH